MMLGQKAQTSLEVIIIIAAIIVIATFVGLSLKNILKVSQDELVPRLESTTQQAGGN